MKTGGLEILRELTCLFCLLWWKGCRCLLLEAMACGLACLQTDVGADGEVLDRSRRASQYWRATSELRTRCHYSKTILS